MINVRTFRPESPQGNPFHYGIRDAERAAALVRRLATDGLHVVVNETIDVKDGGVSGVLFGDIIEFAPHDTPRCVDKPGTAIFPRAEGIALLELTYGFRPQLTDHGGDRVEFSIHPLKAGLRSEHTVVWEVGRFDREQGAQEEVGGWPNRFSRFIGDKAFGLLVAHVFGLPVPFTTVICRNVAPFSFGLETNTGERWLRTCPAEQTPGKYVTSHGWNDPFVLLSGDRESKIVSIISQHAVLPQYSGATISNERGAVLTQGVAGKGDRFMLGGAAPEPLPEYVREAIQRLFLIAKSRLGPVRFEWVFDGNRPWIVQLHHGKTKSTVSIIYPGEASFRDFPVENGIEQLRKLIAENEKREFGIVLVGDIGVTSHMGDLLRKARIPSRIRRPDDPTQLELGLLVR